MSFHCILKGKPKVILPIKYTGCIHSWWWTLITKNMIWITYEYSYHFPNSNRLSLLGSIVQFYQILSVHKMKFICLLISVDFSSAMKMLKCQNICAWIFHVTRCLLPTRVFQIVHFFVVRSFLSSNTAFHICVMLHFDACKHCKDTLYILLHGKM